MKYILFLFCFFNVAFTCHAQDSRENLHNSIIKSFVEEIAAQQPTTTPHIVILMGGAAHGKSSVLELIIPVKTGLKLCLSTDRIRQKIPEYVIGIQEKNPNIASEVHQECLRLNELIVKELFEKKLSFIYESTGADPAYTQWLLSLSNKGNYKISVFFVDADLDIAIERAVLRGQMTGRTVPASVVEKSHKLSKENFLNLLPQLTEWVVIENSGEEPKIVWEKKQTGLPICYDPNYILPVNNPIFEIEKFNAVEPYLTEGSWIFTDIDDTLITSAEAVGRDIGRSYLAKKIRLADPETAEKWRYALAPLLDQIKTYPVETSTPSLLQDWHNRNIPIIGLTARPFEGKAFEEFIYKTIDQLALHGISLDYQTASYCLENEPVKLASGAVFYKGVLFAGNRPKGKVLMEFLSMCMNKPNNIVYIDNKLRHVQSVIEYCHSINLFPFHYIKVVEKNKKLSEEVAYLQLKTFADEGFILSDEEAREILSNENELYTQAM